MRVVFRVDSSLEIGAGHVMRCLSLADIIRNQGSDVFFICRNHSGNLIEYIERKKYKVFTIINKEKKNLKLDSNLIHAKFLGESQTNDAKECFQILSNIQPDWLILDHYGIDRFWQEILSSTYDKLMVIDDLADREHISDLLLDQTLGRKKEDYSNLVPKYCDLLLGPQFALLRNEFMDWRDYSLKRRLNPEFKKLLISMGGIDTNNVTEKVLIGLEKCQLPRNLKIIVILGGKSPHLEGVKLKIRDFPYNVELKVNVQNMAEIMANCDVAIGAAGSTTWERCCLGIPSIQIVIAENQKLIAKAIYKINAAINIDINNIGMISKALIEVNNKLQDLCKNSSQVTNGSGIYKVIEHIL